MKLKITKITKETLFALLLFGLMFVASEMFAQHQIGHTQITFQDASRGNRSIQTEIYYPASVAGNNVAIESGSYPVIVFGHGFVMAWDAYKNLWEEFVPRGYIMVFPRTEGSIFGTDHQKFGWDLQFLVTQMQNEGATPSSLFYQGVASETALMGHSMGGGAAFLAADSLAGNGNNNLKTLIGLAPAESSSNGVSSINSALSVTVPSLILSGSQDGVTPPIDHHIPMYNNLASDCKTFINVLGGAHCYFANTNTACDFGEGTSSSGISITRAEQHEVTFDFVNLWLDYTLKGDCNAFSEFNDSLQNSARVNFNQDCVLPSFNVAETANVCSGESYTFPDGTTQNNITSQVVYTSNLLSVDCLDSNVTTTVNVNPVYTNNESASVCSGESYTFPDGTTQNNITSQVVHTSNLQTVSSCDSVIVTTVNVNSTYTYSESASVCSGESYTFPDGTTQNNITSQVVYTSNLQTVTSCDSVIVTTVNVNSTYSNSESASVCSGESYTFPDGTTQNNITSQVVHTSNLQTVSSCDSVIVTTVNVNSTYTYSESASVCSGESYTFPDGTTQNNITSQVVYTSNLQTVTSCDSIIVTTVNVNSTYTNNESASICSGESYTFPDGTTQNNITSQVVYTSNLQTVSSCDSIIVTTVNVNSTYTNNESASICSGESYTFPDGTTQNNITSQVIYTSSLQTVSSCDSVIVTTVNVNSVNVSVTQVNENTLSADEVGVDYQWIDCSDDSFISGEMNQTFIANNNGSFAVQVTENGCVDTSSCYSIIGVGLNENNFNDSHISLYPNPTNGNVIVKLGDLKEVDISIIDITGKVVKMLTVLNESQVNLRLDDLSNGLYYVKFYSFDKQWVVKLIKH